MACTQILVHKWGPKTRILALFRSLTFRGTQQQFLENICSEDDLRSRIFRTFVVKFLACLPLLGFLNPPKMVYCPFSMDFYPKKVM